MIDPPIPPADLAGDDVPPERSDKSLCGSQNTRHVKKVPLRLTFSTSSQSSSDRLEHLASRVMPAQLTRIDATGDGDDADAEATSSAFRIAFSTSDLFVTSHRDVSIAISIVFDALWHSTATESNLSCWLSAKRRLQLRRPKEGTAVVERGRYICKQRKSAHQN